MKRIKNFLTVISKYFIPFMLLNETVFVKIFEKEFWRIRIVFSLICIVFYLIIRVVSEQNRPISKKEYILFAILVIHIVLNFTNNMGRRILGYPYTILVWGLFYFNLDIFFDKNINYKKVISFFSPFVFCSMILSGVALLMWLKKYSYWDEKLKYFIGYMQGLNYGTSKKVDILYGLYLDTNHAATFSLFSFILSAFACFKGRYGIVFKSINALNVAIQIGYIYLTKSRGIIVTIALILILVVVMYALRKYRENKKIIAFLILLCLIVGLFSGIKIYEKITTKGFTSSRLKIWDEGLNMFFENFFFGVGINRTKDFALKNPTIYPILSGGKALHNSFLDLFVAYGFLIGIPVIIMLIDMLIFLIRETYAKRICSLYLLMFLILGISSFFLSCLFLGLNLMNVLFAVTCGIVRIKIKNDKGEKFG